MKKIMVVSMGAVEHQEIRPDEEALIEAILHWAMVEYRETGRLPVLGIRVMTSFGVVKLVKEESRLDDEVERDDSEIRFGNLELD